MMDRHESLEEDPVAIVGIACHLPGGVRSPSSLWDLLSNGRSGHGEVPSSRFNAQGFERSKGPTEDSNVYRPRGYFLQEDVREFDPEFFGVLNAEALHMDPQQRKLLEVVYECFESAGLQLDQISGSDTGCYVGNFTYDYLVMQSKDPDTFSRFSATGMGPAILSNRISHSFNLKGPSLVIDTACSSSLYCIHTACTAIKTGDCDAAVVASANLIQSVEHYLAMEKAGFLSPESMCHTFSDTANGYGRAEGFGALYLKKLSAAIRDNDPIRAVIRGSAIGSNGKTGGISAPDAIAQAGVIRKAYQRAGLDLSATSYVECHGTGTSAGDLAELQGLSQVFSGVRTSPLLIGSIKPNIGHGEALSGLSGIIKTTLSLEARQIPATINVGRVNPKLKLKEWGLEIAQENREWQPLRLPDSRQDLLRASISSFGYGGANGHLIMENADAWRRVSHNCQNTSQPQTWFILPLSAHNFETLDRKYLDLRCHELENYSTNDLAYTLGCRRTEFSCRGYVICKENEVTEMPPMIIPRGKTRNSTRPSPSSLAFIYTGQGAQWIGVAKELFEEFPVFRDTITDLDNVIKQLAHAPSWSMESVLRDTSPSSIINEAAVAQPLVTAIQVAVTQLLYSWGIRPKAVVGHSSGEIAAAFAAGHVSARDAIIAAYYRGYVNDLAKVPGAMLAVGLNQGSVTREIERLKLGQTVQIGCINSPENVTVTGDYDSIHILAQELQSRGILARVLKTGGKAYHSRHMLALGPKLEELLLLPYLRQSLISKNETSKPRFISTVTGDEKHGGFDSNYWRTNMESPVLFAQAIRRLLKDDEFHFLEIGPHSTLELPLKQIYIPLGFTSESAPYSSALTRGKDGAYCILKMVGQLWAHGHQIPFDKVNPGANANQASVITGLPSYPWNYKKVLWREPRASFELRTRQHSCHELLGSIQTVGDGQILQWHRRLRLQDVPWLQGHKLESSVVFPGAGYIAMAAEAALQASESLLQLSHFEVQFQQVTIHSALQISGEDNELFTSLHQSQQPPEKHGLMAWTFEITSTQVNVTTTHCTGSVIVCNKGPDAVSTNLVEPRSLKPQSIRACYRKLAEVGLNFGDDFQSLETLRSGPATATEHFGSAVSSLSPRAVRNYGRLPHPITLDALLQTGILAASAGSSSRIGGMVPTFIESAIISSELIAESSFHRIVAHTKSFEDTTCVDVDLRTNDQTLVRFVGVEMTPYTPALQIIAPIPQELLFKTTWKPTLMLTSAIGDSISDYVNLVLFEHFGITDSSDLIFSVNAVVSLLKFAFGDPKVLVLKSQSSQSEDSRPSLTGKVSALDNNAVAIPADRQGLLCGKNAALLEEVAPVHGKEPEYDVVLSTGYSGSLPDSLSHVLKSTGVLITTSSDDGETRELQGFKIGIRAGPITLYQKKPAQTEDVKLVNIVIVEADDAGPTSRALVSSIASTLVRPFVQTSLSRLPTLVLPKKSTIISLLEIEKPLLRSISQAQLSCLKTMTENASKIAWITAGDLLASLHPDFSLVTGLARTLMAEEPDLSFYVLDVPGLEISLECTTKNITALLKQQDDRAIDFEFIQRNGVLHISRFSQDTFDNKEHFDSVGPHVMEPTSKPETAPYRRDSWTTGHSLYSSLSPLPQKQEPIQCEPLHDGNIQIDVSTFGISSQILPSDSVKQGFGLGHTSFAGIVSRISGGVFAVKEGDTVVGMAPGRPDRQTVMPAWACCQVSPRADLQRISSMVYIYSAAIYAIKDRARLTAGETILIHGANVVQYAATQISRIAGGRIIVVVKNETERAWVIETSGLNPENVVISNDNVIQHIQRLTNKQGVDLFLDVSSNRLQCETEEVCSSFGRVVDLDTDALVTPLDPKPVTWSQNVTYCKVLLSDLFYSPNTVHHQRWSTLLQEAIGLYNAGLMDRTPYVQHYNFAGRANSIGRSRSPAPSCISISAESPKRLIDTQQPLTSAVEFKIDLHQPSPGRVSLDHSKTYIIVGGTGGIGASLAEWMLSCGARKILLLSRSGRTNDNSKFLTLIASMCGATIDIAKCDVTQHGEVDRVVSEIAGDIGGIVHSAMGLSEKLFSQMSAESWHAGISAKVQGAWNLHNALNTVAKNVDFFLMISSVSGSVAQVAQANYSAANHFLDTFARYRQSLGLPAISVALGMISDVGYLADNPEVEDKLARTGISALNEEQMLRVIETALARTIHRSTGEICPSSNASEFGNLTASETSSLEYFDSLNDFSSCHLLTGLEDVGKVEFLASSASNYIARDPRMRLLIATANDAVENGAASNYSEDKLPEDVQLGLSSGLSLHEAVGSSVKSGLARIISLDADALDVSKTLIDYGIDSMIATEIRTWLFQTFGVNISLFDVLSSVKSVDDLVNVIAEAFTKNESSTKE